MSDIYYIYSKSELSESLYICRNGERIERPFIKSNVYPLGIILSKIMRTLNPWFYGKNQLKYNNGKWFPLIEIPNLLLDFSNEDSSFSSIACEDKNLKATFNELLYRDISDKGYDAIYRLLTEYNSFINTYCKDKSNETMDKLNELVINKHITFPENFILPIENKVEMLEEGNSSQIFDPEIVKNKLFNFPKNICGLKKYRTLKKPLNIYKINSVSDLILACLQCIFENKNSLVKCRYCGDYFISTNRKKKYCHNYNEKNLKDDCYHKSNRQHTLQNEQLLSRKMHKSLRTYYARKYGETSDEYRNYMDESQKWRDDIKVGIETEENFVAWLETKFFRKYK